MNIQTTITATLHVTPEFTGKVMVYIVNGEVKSDMRVLDGEYCTSVKGFIELARMAGWNVTPVREVCHV